MTRQRILVTGASGFVGRHLLPALGIAFPEAEIIGTSRRPGVVISGIPALQLDPTRPRFLRGALAELRPDAAIHLAGMAAVARAFRYPKAAWRANLWQTLDLAEAVRTSCPDAQFVLASSAEIYGLSFRSGQALDETATLRPASPYAAAKAAADIAVGEMALRGLRSIRLRPVNHTGPGQSADFVVPAFARQIARIEAGLQKPVIRTGSLDRARDFLDVRDVCAGYVAAIRQGASLAPGAVFNLASGHARRIDEILQELLRLAGIDAEIVQQASAIRPTDIEISLGNAAAAKQQLGWTPAIDFSTTLRDTLGWWRTRIEQDRKTASAREA